MRKWGTCFFELYAQITLERIVSPEYSLLVNMDKPDLQSPDHKSIGIEVTRAMKESKDVAKSLLKEMSGIVPREDEGLNHEDLDRMLSTGYAYGLTEGKIIGTKEFDYWSMALPLRRVVDSKVAKCINGFYGDFDRLGLYVFSKDPISYTQAQHTCSHIMSLQKLHDRKYCRLYLSEICNLFVCNLEDGLAASSRIVDYPISQQMRREFYLEATRRNLQGQ